MHTNGVGMCERQQHPRRRRDHARWAPGRLHAVRQRGRVAGAGRAAAGRLFFSETGSPAFSLHDTDDDAMRAHGRGLAPSYALVPVVHGPDFDDAAAVRLDLVPSRVVPRSAVCQALLHELVPRRRHHGNRRDGRKHGARKHPALPTHAHTHPGTHPHCTGTARQFRRGDASGRCCLVAAAAMGATRWLLAMPVVCSHSSDSRTAATRQPQPHRGNLRRELLAFNVIILFFSLGITVALP